MRVIICNDHSKIKRSIMQRMPTEKAPDAEAQATLLERQRQLIEELQTLVNHVPYGLMVLEPGGVFSKKIEGFDCEITAVPSHGYRLDVKQ